MAWIDGITQGLYSWQNQVVQVYRPGSSTAGYVDPITGKESDDTSDYETYSYVVYGTPLRDTKCLFVPEMPDFFSDSELNTTYHSVEEYSDAVSKYGLVYKSQKFPNADTPQKLLEYACDWIKNNYHGGVINFNVSALDLHILDSQFRKFIVGQRVVVQYMDPALQQETDQTLTVISAEYDLNNPEKNTYKIGIPDVTLNKVYGETSKSGGGGGGGKKESSETDNETGKEVDGLVDNAEADASRDMEFFWGYVSKAAKNGDTDFQYGDLFTPTQKDPTSDWTYGLTPDFMKTGKIQSSDADFSNVLSKYIKASGGVDAKKGSFSDMHTTTINNDDKTTTKDLEASNNVTAAEKVQGKNIEATNNITAAEKIQGKNGEFTTMKIGGNTFGVGMSGGKPQITINGRTFTLSTTE